jgi:hypothetical protein
MKNTIIIAALALISLQLSSCSKIKGEGPIVIENRSVTNFNAISSDISGDVFVRQDSVFKVEVRGQKNILDKLNTSVSGNQLNIKFDKNTFIGFHSTIELYISCPSIASLELNGSGNLTMMNKCTSTSLNLSLSGSGKLMLTELNTNKLNSAINGSGDIVVQNGWATTFSGAISGSGSIDAMGIETDYAKVEISGSGNARLKVKQQLDIDLSGSGDIYYKGEPALNIKKSGSGKVHKQ